MPGHILGRTREAIRNGEYDMTAHAFDEIAEDALHLVDVEAAILNGRLMKTERDDLRGIRYTLHGTGADGSTLLGTVGRFTETGRYLIITVYEVTER
jgi:hypothetical protein